MMHSMGFEDSILRKIDREKDRTELSPFMKKAFEKASGILKDPDYAIQESDFESVYEPESVEKDIENADRLEKKFESQNTPEGKRLKKVADILESIVLMHSELSNWFGENAQTLKTSRHDDYVNKVDMITEWTTPTDSRILALAVDVTFGTASIQKKLETIKAEIDDGKLGSIKYFRDGHGDFMGTRNNVPRIVIGASESTVEKLADLWIQNKNKDLETHPIQYLFAHEMETQLGAMLEYAIQEKQDDAMRAYEQALEIVRGICAEKLQFKSEEMDTDPVAQEILRHTKEQFNIETGS